MISINLKKYFTNIPGNPLRPRSPLGPGIPEPPSRPGRPGSPLDPGIPENSKFLVSFKDD